MYKKITSPVSLSVIWFILVIIIAHLFVPSYYTIKLNTISEMGAQHLPNAWIMRVGFISFGIFMTISLLLFKLKNKSSWVIIIPFIIYSLCIGITGIWSTVYQPIPSVPYNTEANIHSLFATIAGFTLTLTVALCAIFSKDKKNKLINWTFVILITGISYLFGALPAYQGIVQRLLYLVSFTWMIFFFKPIIIKEIKND